MTDGVTSGAVAVDSAVAHGPGTRVAALDGLRGAAVLAVVLFHSDRLQGGFLGVDLFFVLSGFLITSLLVSEWQHSGRIALGAFWARRARRLLPALLVALAGVVGYAVWLAKPAELAVVRAEGLATLAYVANIRSMLAGHGYWDQYVRSPLEHTWSLAIEEQFYLVWPLVVVACLRWGRGSRAVLAVASLGALAGTALMLRWSYAGVDPSRLYLGTDTRVAGLLIGAALAAALAGHGPVRSRWASRAVEGLGLIGVAVLAVAWFRVDGTGPWIYRGGLFLCGLAAAAVIAACTAKERGLVARLFEPAPLRGLGLISYGVYLWHWPVNFAITTTRTGLDGWALVGARAAVTLAVSLASYHLVEMPIRRGVLPGRRAGFALAAALSALAVAFVSVPGGAASRDVALPGAGGFGAGIVVPPADASAAGVAIAAGSQAPGSGWSNAGRAPARRARPGVVGTAVEADYSQLTNRCLVNEPPSPFARPTSPGPRLLVVGDSVACYLGAALEVGQRGYGFQVLNRAELGCLLVRPVAMRNQVQEPRPACPDRWRPIVAGFEPQVSVVLAGGLNPEAFDTGDGRWRDPCDPIFALWYEAGVRRAAALLGATGGRVALVSLVHLPDHVDIGPGIDIPQRYQRWTSCLNRSLRTVAEERPTVDFLDLDAFVCPQGVCRDQMNGIVMREDGRHFQGAAADLVARWLVPRLHKLLVPPPLRPDATPDGPPAPTPGATASPARRGR